MSEDLYMRYINAALYGPPPSREVSASEGWDYLITNSPDWPGHYYRQGDGVRMVKGGVQLTRTEHEWIPDEATIADLKALMDAWRERGLSNYADSVETQQDEDGETFSVYESLGRPKSKRISKTLPLSDVKFYKELPRDPVEGLKKLISAPRANARITGLSTTGMP